MGLQSRLLATLAVLVFLAIASTGWLTLQVARTRLDALEEARGRALAEAVAGVLGGVAGQARPDPAGGPGVVSLATPPLLSSMRGLLGVGGIREVVVVDALGHPVFGEPGDDAGFPAVLGGAGTLLRRDAGILTIHAPLRAAGEPTAGTVGAVRLRLAINATLAEAVRGSTSLLIALTLVDGGLILLFGALFFRGVVHPIEELARAAGRVARGDLEVPDVEPGEGGEVGALTTSFNQMTAALRDERARLAASREQVIAQEKLATVGRLAAGVAHEIGNPLTTILGYTELLLREERDAETRTSLERIRGETERIHRIVHDLLDYSRPVAEEVEPVDLAQVVRAAAELLAPQPRFRSVVLRTDFPADLPAVAASSQRLLQVVLNLLLNAADAMHGAGEVHASARLLDGNRVALDLADTGPGVPPDLRDKIFDPFFTTKDPGAGTGLGLAICRSILHAFGGEITLAPSEKGATFRLTLPAMRRSP